jgi:hypothetical protein
MRINCLLAIGTVFLLGASALSAQDLKVSNSAPTSISNTEIDMLRKDLRDQKKQIVAANMPLTGDEAAKFWPLYDEYTQETIKLNDERYGLVKEYATNYATMTDAQAANFIRRWIGVDEKASKLRQSWIPKFEKVIGEKKAATFTQIDRRVGLMIELQLSSMMPLVNP